MWWTKKYNLPWNHNLFQSSSVEDLLVEFYVDLFMEMPSEKYRQEDGTYRITDSDDPYINKWEEEIASGAIPNMEEAFTPAQLEWYKRIRKKQSVLVDPAFNRSLSPSSTQTRRVSSTSKGPSWQTLEDMQFGDE